MIPGGPLEVGGRSRLFPVMNTPKNRGRALVVGAALAMTTAFTSACSVADPLPPVALGTPAPSGWILFQQDAGTRQEVALIRADGSGRTALVHDLGEGHQTNPDWSPDGKHVVFAMNDGERDDLWVADVDGEHARLLLDCRGRCRWLDDPAWSPDGKRIVYSRTIERADGWGIGTLETVAVATGQVRVELGPWKRSFTAGARFSPDGRQVVFEKVHKTGRGPESDIDAVTLSAAHLDKKTHPVRALTDPRLFAATADWSPDGKRIVYSALAERDAEAPDLFWIRPSGGAPTRLTDVVVAGGFAAEPAWLPDGSGVLFSGLLEEGSGSPELLSVRLDGTGVGPAFGDQTVFGRHPRAQPAS